MKRKIFLTYTCNAWHNDDSKDLIGIYSTEEKTIAAIKRYHKNETNKRLPADLVEELVRHKQTQGLALNYIFEEHSLNEDQWTTRNIFGRSVKVS